MIDVDSARTLLDFDARIRSPQRAEQQLRGAVAIHNILKRHGVAYLADEVGLGKTYVALGALALFRHFDPNFRVLVIAPRENIQRKWQKDFGNFVAHNLRYDDLRVRAPGGRPARAMVHCGSLLDLVREATLDPERDFFARLTSFSLPLGSEPGDFARERDKLRRELPWIGREALDLRSKDAFKQNYARAVCCALPMFDLVIVDEAHNLKHGYSSGAARNRVLADAFGRAESPKEPWFARYGARARRVLFLSATPIEETYRHLWNQLDVFGLAAARPEWSVLRDDDGDDAAKKQAAAQFLVRRVTSLDINGRAHTKNLYRREWRAGGIAVHDEPIVVADARRRLVVALVQKKVSELLNGKRFNNAFQVGMLASFESFLETAKLKRDDEGVFDGDQPVDPHERDGVDVDTLNGLARSYRERFKHELPHPKMDAVVDDLAASWESGRKTLVFVRRVASVKELKRKLDERYDRWLIGEMRTALPRRLANDFESIVTRYLHESELAKRRDSPEVVDERGDDAGGNDTFFAWFFRGKGPGDGILSGAAMQERFRRSSQLATFFHDNIVMALLGVESDVVDALVSRCGRLSREELENAIRERSCQYLSAAKEHTSANRFEAAQAAALDLLRERQELGALAQRAEVVWNERYSRARQTPSATQAPAKIASLLDTVTFFSALQRREHAALAAALWPRASLAAIDPDAMIGEYRERTLRAALLSSAARLGHAFVDLYLCAISGRASLRAGSDADEDDSFDGGAVLAAYLDRLERQRASPDGRCYGAFDELAQIAQHFDLIVDVNLAETKTATPVEVDRAVTALMSRQQPVGGVSGGHPNRTLVRQFRMPGYPFVLIATEVLQEGEDLHTFCSSVMHYGISWTPSSMEQRIGRVDRVRSSTERRLTPLARAPQPDELLQVYYPYLRDTVETLQVNRVLDRMNAFLRLMHEGLDAATAEQRSIDVAREILVQRRSAAYDEPLRSAFPLPAWALEVPSRAVAVAPDAGRQAHERFARLCRLDELDGIGIAWSRDAAPGVHRGIARLDGRRVQPFHLALESRGGRVVVHCVSVIGRVAAGLALRVVALAAKHPARIGSLSTSDAATIELTIEDDVTLGSAEHDAARVGLLVRRVVEYADRLERQLIDAARDSDSWDFAAYQLENERDV